MVRKREPGGSKRLQFGLSSMLATALMLALLFGYLRPFGPDAVAVCGLVVLVAALVGGIAGAVAGRNPDTLFWSVIGAVFAYLAVVGFALYHWSSAYIWPLVGMAAGTTVGAFGQGRPVRRMAFGSLAATAVFASYVLLLFGLNPDLGYELLCAVLGGALLGLVAEIAERFEKRTAIPRYVLATALVVAAILGHWIVPRVIPGL
ncbi:MAG TPA: hypothetical protein VMY37_03245 [Thermoguttaceae bacterium]|nr:hypothetical protein [Thermoguttaceae bacterium]